MAKRRKLSGDDASPEMSLGPEGESEVLQPDIDPEVASIGESEGSDAEEESPFEELFAAVMGAADEGRKVSTLFQLLPSRSMYPDYYQYIKEPIDLKMIGTKIQSNAYPTLNDLEKDLLLMIRNAKYYNEPGSQVYKDANLLRRILVSKKNEIDLRKYNPPNKANVEKRTKSRRRRKSGGQPQQKLSAFAANLQYEDAEDMEQNAALPSGNASLASGDETMMDDVNDSDPEDSSDPAWIIYDTVRSYKDANGNSNISPFMRLPSRRFYPDYYQEIKNPISLAKIQSRIKGGMYRDATQVVEDLNVMFENAKKYNRPDSKIFDDACQMQKAMLAKAKEILNYSITGNVDDDDDDEEEEVEEPLEETSLVIPPVDIKLENSQMSVKDDTENEESNDGPLNVSACTSSVANMSSMSLGGTGPATPFSVTVKKKIAKRLVTGYIIFASEVRKSVVQANPDCNFGDISRIIGTEWKNLAAELKTEYEKKAQKQNEETAREAAKDALERPPSPNQQVIQNAVFECHWEHKCDFQCEDTNDLFEHLTAEPTGHVWKSYDAFKDKEENIFQCLFHGCGRVKKGAAPFPSILRLIRHIKEVHINKQQPKSIPPGKRGRNFLPSKYSIQNNLVDPPILSLEQYDSGDGSNSHPPASPRQAPELVYECHWEGKCDYLCEDALDLLDHLTAEPNGHVWRSYEKDKDKEENIFQCLYGGCGRVKKGATPFPTVIRLIKHVKDIHVTKQTPKPIPLEKRRNFQPSKTNPHPITIPVQQQIAQPIQTITTYSSPAPAHQFPQNNYWANKSPTKSTATQVEPEEPLFCKPAAPRLVHSSTYIKYIERLRPDFKHITNWSAQLGANADNTAPDRTKLPAATNWLVNGTENHGNAVNALWALRNLMFQDCLKIAPREARNTED